MGGKAKDFLMGNKAVIVPLLILIALPLVQIDIMAFILNLLIVSFMYVCLAQSWNILAGFCGLLSMGHCAFFGLGAYITIMVLNLHLNIVWAILAAAAANMALAYIVGAISVRVKDIFFAMVTLALAQLLYNLSMQWVEVTRGPRGLIMPQIYMMDRQTLFYIALAMTALFVFAIHVIRESRMGTMFVALRENEDLAKSLGVNVAKWKIAASVVSAVMASLVGSYYVLYIRSVQPPAVFTFNVTMKIMIVAFVGGKGTVKGPLLGAVIIILDELIRGWLGGGRYSGLPGIIYGIILALVILFLPNGLISIFRGRRKAA
ncbi:MAG: branched-chain amino acid ABC transporter permease [Clostridiales Family XIII bacterium]|jgi:branched-chain amino acid transport system permease protein|nr:branched-chain amino acid ABC transporter permease [Clostridiales Family XIII bacterium]